VGVNVARFRLFLNACSIGVLLLSCIVCQPDVAVAQSGVTFSGQVVDTNGNPVPNLTLDLGNQSVDTDSNGNFAVTVPAGMTTVLYALDVGGTPGHPGNEFQGTFQVDLSSSLTNQVLTIPAAVNLTIQVTDPNGNPVPGAQIYPPQDGGWSCVTSPFDILPGVTTQLANNYGTVMAWNGGLTDSNGDSTMATEPCHSAADQITVAPPASSGLASTTVNYPTYDTNYLFSVVVYSVEGVLTSGSGAAIGSATVTLTSSARTAGRHATGASAATTTYTTVTNSSGFFGMKVPAGSYKLVMKSKTNGKTQPTNYSVTVKSVKVNGTNLGIIAIPFITAKIKVLSPSHTPVAGAILTEVCTSSETLALSSVLTGQGTTCDHSKTGAKGSASLISLPTSSATITATPPSTSGLCSATFSLNLSANTATTETLTSGCP
jgi:hypothetical protein